MTSKENPLPIPTYTLARREQLLGLDLRSLALFRIGLALIIIVDLTPPAGSPALSRKGSVGMKAGLGCAVLLLDISRKGSQSLTPPFPNWHFWRCLLSCLL